MAAELDDQARQNLAIEAGRVFTPTAPIDERSLFAGRETQVRQVVDAINQKGQHAIIFGERGVGKTSLANVLSGFLSAPNSRIVSPRVTCDSQDTFESVWKKVFQRIELQYEVSEAGFGAAPQNVVVPSAQLLLPDHQERVTTDVVRRILIHLSQDSVPIIIVDEFDALSERSKRAFADMIKMLSDDAVAATVILVGVADSVDQLIKEHQSVERALVQVPMPRMSPDEIGAIIDKGLTLLGMTIDDAPRRRIVLLSQGLPHYTHLLSLYSVRQALDNLSLRITDKTVSQAISQALTGAQRTIHSAYHRATMSPRKDNLFAVVLLSCALAKTDELGYFMAQDVRTPMREITGKQYDIPSFSQHLNEFCEEKRGPILQRLGTTRRFRFRFINPLMQPFVIMQGFSTGLVDKNVLDRIESPRA